MWLAAVHAQALQDMWTGQSSKLQCTVTKRVLVQGEWCIRGPGAAASVQALQEEVSVPPDPADLQALGCHASPPAQADLCSHGGFACHQLGRCASGVGQLVRIQNGGDNTLFSQARKTKTKGKTREEKTKESCTNFRLICFSSVLHPDGC